MSGLPSSLLSLLLWLKRVFVFVFRMHSVRAVWPYPCVFRSPLLLQPAHPQLPAPHPPLHHLPQPLLFPGQPWRTSGKQIFILDVKNTHFYKIKWHPTNLLVIFLRWNSPTCIMTDLKVDLIYDRLMTYFSTVIKWISPSFCAMTDLRPYLTLSRFFLLVLLETTPLVIRSKVQ